MDSEYLESLKAVLTRSALLVPAAPPERRSKRALFRGLSRVLSDRHVVLARAQPVDPEGLVDGRVWPATAETMIGMPRLNNLQRCVEDVLERGVPGDLIETGVWRGGAVIFMRAVLRAHMDPNRVVWVADSFQGLPPPRPGLYPADEGDLLHAAPELAVSLETVRSNFAKYGLLDDRVRFLEGWFHDTLPTAPIDQLAVMRLDGDMYESTIVALDALYPKLSPGGYAIIDDYGAVPACKQAVDDFRHAHAITEPFEWIDWTGIFWQRRS